MNKSHFAAITLALSACFGAVQAAPVFADDFESSLALANGNWTLNSSGLVAADPIHSGNHAVLFTTTRGGGDLWSKVLAGGTYTLSFDVLGTCSRGTPANCGAFIGINDALGEHWLAGDATYGSPHLMQTTGEWQHISFIFTAVGDFRLKMEDFNGQPRDIYFDNLCISATVNDGACPGAGGGHVPEPASLALVGAALAGAALARRRKGVAGAR